MESHEKQGLPFPSHEKISGKELDTHHPQKNKKKEKKPLPSGRNCVSPSGRKIINEIQGKEDVNTDFQYPRHERSCPGNKMKKKISGDHNKVDFSCRNDTMPGDLHTLPYK